MITAKEARELAGPTLEEKVEDALNDLSTMIENAAVQGGRLIVVRKEPYATWGYNKNNPGEVGEVGEKVLEELIKAGFKVDTFYRELQFVDYGLEISW